MATDITKVRRHPERASYDKELLLDILERGLVCQVAFQQAGLPFIIPMTYYNDSDYIYIHGSPAARISNTLRDGPTIAISVLELNGLVLAKGLADNSMNYRSAIIFGKPEELLTEEEKMSFFKEWIDRLIPGRKEDTALPNHDELKTVSVFRIKLDQFSVKVRRGGPSELRKDQNIWSGVVPLSISAHDPVFASSPHTPEYLQKFIDRKNEEWKRDKQA
ncbi:MAG: pyridoxamine 5'-phosphate oxidase family protein [Thermoplasmata archaeon]